MLTVDELMITELYTLREDESVHRAHELMSDHKIRHIPVLDHHEHLVGLLTQRDVLSAAVSIFADIDDDERDDIESHIPIREIMTSSLIVAEVGTDLRMIAQHLLDSKHGCVPVVKDKKLIGIITEADFVKLALGLMDRLAAYENRSTPI